MNLGQACRPCRGSRSLIPGRGCFGDLPGDEIVVSPPSLIVEPLPSPPDRSTSFSVKAESPALPCRISIQYDSYYSIFWRINNQQTPFWPRVIDTKDGQNLVFDPGGSIGRLRACPFLETWRALLWGEFFVRVVDEAITFLGGWMTSSHELTGNNSLFLRSGWSENAMPSLTAQEYRSQWINICQEHHEARSLMAKNFTERLMASEIWT